MKRRTVYIATIVAFCASMYGCGKSIDKNDRILAKVSNSVITASELNARIAKLPPYYQKIVEKDKKKYNELIKNENG